MRNADLMQLFDAAEEGAIVEISRVKPEFEGAGLSPGLMHSESALFKSRFKRISENPFVSTIGSA